MKLSIPDIDFTNYQKRRMPAIRVIKQSTRIVFSLSAVNLMNLNKGDFIKIGKDESTKKWFIFKSDDLGSRVLTHSKGENQPLNVILSNKKIGDILRENFDTSIEDTLILELLDPIKDDDGIFYELKKIQNKTLIANSM